jgi:hypothetical protein
MTTLKINVKNPNDTPKVELFKRSVMHSQRMWPEKNERAFNASLAYARYLNAKQASSQKLDVYGKELGEISVKMFMSYFSKVGRGKYGASITYEADTAADFITFFKASTFRAAPKNRLTKTLMSDELAFGYAEGTLGFIPKIFFSRVIKAADSVVNDIKPLIKEAVSKVL